MGRVAMIDHTTTHQGKELIRCTSAFGEWDAIGAGLGETCIEPDDPGEDAGAPTRHGDEL